ncbi:MAG: ribonuclease HII [Campylobacterales bacterium]|nr:ribonuclease HII [Campylobacterales bacterium]MBE0499690.1 ribonuclease HII [Campylobacterales bacterium]
MALCGIDEAGRGPIAGPLVMAGVILTKEIEGLNDSKQLSEKKREALFPLILAHSHYHIVTFSALEVDTLGISKCLSQGLKSIMQTLQSEDFLFDGNTTFGVSGLRTLVKADEKIPEVSAASILAKVSRDTEMVKLAKKFPNYGFETHKGYGTAEHIEAIKRHGYCDIHRRSFKLKALQPTLF